MYIHLIFVGCSKRKIGWRDLKGKKETTQPPTPRYDVWWEKKGYTFCRHGTLHDRFFGKKEFESQLKKTESFDSGRDFLSCGTAGTAATAPGKTATAWRRVPIPRWCAPIMRRLPHPSSHSGRHGDADGNGCVATKRRLPVFPSGLQRSGSGDPDLVPDPRLGTSVLQTRWLGNTGW
jgi:hypothetical protein